MVAARWIRRTEKIAGQKKEELHRRKCGGVALEGLEVRGFCRRFVGSVIDWGGMGMAGPGR